MLSGIYGTVCQAPPVNSNGDFFFGWDYVSTMYLLSSTVLTHLNRISTQNFNKDLDQFLIVMFIVFLIIIIFFYEFSFLYCMKKLQNHFFWLNHFDRMISNASIQYAWIIIVMCSSLILTRKPEKRYLTGRPLPDFFYPNPPSQPQYQRFYLSSNFL